MQVVEVGNPAAVGLFVFHLTIAKVDAQPGVATRTRQGNIQLVIRPLALLMTDAHRHLLIEPALQHQGHTVFSGMFFCLHKGQYVGGNLRRLIDDMRMRFNLRRVIEGDAGGRKEQHGNQASRRADPVPLMQLLQPERTALLLRHLVVGLATDLVTDLVSRLA